MAGVRRCVDCSEGSRRPAPRPGPRCQSHHREVVKQRREAAWARHIQTTYQLTPAQYYQILEHQGGTCYLCPAKGMVRKLAVDHDHKCCPTTPTCGRCTRGLLCRYHNRMFGIHRDSPESFERAADYLRNPPARAVLAA